MLTVLEVLGTDGILKGFVVKEFDKRLAHLSDDQVKTILAVLEGR